jgi:hypothetical protein
MSNPPTTITRPTPLIENQPGSVIYYLDISDNFNMDTSENTFPAPSTKYSLQNSSGTILSTYTTSKYNEDTLTVYSASFRWPAASAVDTNNYFYSVDVSRNYINAFNPSLNQTNNYFYMTLPFGIKFNQRDSNLYVTTLYDNGGIDSPYGAIITLTPNYNSSLNPSGVNFTYNTFFDTNGNITINENTAPKTDYCSIPYDIEFDNYGNVFISNFGFYATKIDDGSYVDIYPGADHFGFISQLFLTNGVITDVAVIISANPVTFQTLGGFPVPCIQDTNFYNPSGIVYDLSNNFLYVANSDSYGNGQISVYSMPIPGIETTIAITLIATLQNSRAGNGFAYSFTYDTDANAFCPITSLTFDSYGNLYYIFCDRNDSTGYTKNNVYVKALSITKTSRSSISTDLIYSKKIYSSIGTISTTNFNYAYGISIINGSIFFTGNLISQDPSPIRVGGGIIQIQNNFRFNNVTLSSGDNQVLSITPNTAISPSLNSFNVSVPSSITFISNLTPYTNQATIVSYYDNINQANYIVPTSSYIYNLVDSSTNSLVNSVQVVENNEIIYAPYLNELGSLNNPISMDFDSSGNLYVLNSLTNGIVFLNIISPNSGNFQKIYKTTLAITYPTSIRYNKYDNCMYITSFDADLYGTIYVVNTTQQNIQTTKVIFSVSYAIFYANLDGNEYCRGPMDLVFDANDLYVSSAGEMGLSLSGNPWNANITKIPITTYQPIASYVKGTESIIIDQSLLGNFISGIEVDANYIYVVSAPDASNNDYSYSGLPSTIYGNYYTNISQFSKTTGQIIRRFNAGFVGKLPDVANYYNFDSSYNYTKYTGNIGSFLKFDSYGNLFYVTYYDPNNYTQPYYLASDGNFLYNTPTSGNYYVQAFVPSSGFETPVFSHAMATNSLDPIYGFGLYNGDIYVAQYTKNIIIKLAYTLSFGNYGFGASGSESSLILYNESNSYYITGGNSPVYNISVPAKTLNYAFDTSTIITNPIPLLEKCPGILYYYDNPATSNPEQNTIYVLKNSSGKVVSNNYTSPAGNEKTIIYNNLSNPSCIAVDNEGYLYIANNGHAGAYQNGSIVKSTTNGQIIYIKSNVNIESPYAINYNSLDGYIYYANSESDIISGIQYFYIYKMSKDGNTFTQVYQDSSFNYLYNPQQMCFDSSGNIYVANGFTKTSDDNSVNGGITKITMDYSSGEATPTGVQIFSNFLCGLTLNSSSNVILSGLAIDTITDYLYVVCGANDASGNNINISQMPLTGIDAGKVCRKWQTGQVGNAQGKTSLNFDGYGNLYYYYYDTASKIGYLKGFDPYTNTSATYSHTLLGGATTGAYGIIYYKGNFYSSQSSYNSSTEIYIDNLVEIICSYYFTDVTLQAGQNVLSINTTIANEVIVSNIVASASTPKYYTIPAPPIAGQPAQLIFEYDGVITPINGHNYVVVDTNMNYVSGILDYNSSTEPNPYTFTFNNLTLPGGANYLHIFDITTGQIVNIPLCNTDNGYIFIKIPVVCFYKGTKILCAINGKDTYVPIEKIGQGTLVKTYKRGYKKVKYNIMGKLNNTQEHSIDKLFKLSKKRFPKLGLTEDLYITGSHALLHDSLNEREIILMKKVIQYSASNYKSIYNAKIEDKYKLLAYHDERFEEIMMNSVFEIYHIVLENENENFNYGIYANGILAESTDEITLARMKGFEKVNKTSESLEKFINNVNSTKYPMQVKRALLR